MTGISTLIPKGNICLPTFICESQVKRQMVMKYNESNKQSIFPQLLFQSFEDSSLLTTTDNGPVQFLRVSLTECLTCANATTYKKEINCHIYPAF